MTDPLKIDPSVVSQMLCPSLCRAGNNTEKPEEFRISVFELVLVAPGNNEYISWC